MKPWTLDEIKAWSLSPCPVSQQQDRKSVYLAAQRGGVTVTPINDKQVRVSCSPRIRNWARENAMWVDRLQHTVMKR